MLDAHGRMMLEIMGKYDADASLQKGILTPEQMPSALQALRQAIAREEEARAQAIAQAKADQRSPPRFDNIALRQRALPLMNMITRSQHDEVGVTWGV